MICHRFHITCVLFVLLFAVALPAGAVPMSGNLIQGGDFEDTAFLETSGSPDGVEIHRFSQTYDLGKWLGVWGPNSQGGLAGFSTYDDPRDPGETGGDTLNTSGLGTLNRSVDPTDSSNHVMEAVLFRPIWAQWAEAPAGHVSGPIELSFDFYFHDWDPGDSNNRQQVRLYGTDTLPPHDGSYFDANSVFSPTSLDTDLLLEFEWSELGGDPDTSAVAGNINGWINISTDDNSLWTTYTPSVPQAYQYYAAVFTSMTYAESHPYFFIYGGKVTDAPSIMVDNVSLRVAIPEPASLGLLGMGVIALMRRRTRGA